MFLTLVLFYVATKAVAQDHSMSTVTQPPPLPFVDLFTGTSNYYSEPNRKAYTDDYYHTSCPRPDTLSTFASVLGSAAKIMLSAAVIAVLKIVGGKLLLLPITVMVLAKMGLKAFLLWPVISKIMKYMKKKKRKNKSRIIIDCTERLACVLQKFSNSGWGSNFGTALTFSMIEDVDEDGFVAKTMLSILAGDKVAECMSLECNSGSDIS